MCGSACTASAVSSFIVSLIVFPPFIRISQNAPCFCRFSDQTVCRVCPLYLNLRLKQICSPPNQFQPWHAQLFLALFILCQCFISLKQCIDEIIRIEFL